MLTTNILTESYAALSVDETVSKLSANLESGLAPDEAAERVRTFGQNVIEKTERMSALRIFLEQFKSPLILLLLAAVVVTAAIGDYKDALFILAAVAVNAGLGYYQEHKASKVLAELKTYLRQRARVIRGGTESDMDAVELVPGDLIRLAQGDRVPADARLIFVNDLHVDEAVLTGEALPVEKGTEKVESDISLGDQLSMVFAGTLVTQGVATALVCRTGSATELGRIAVLVGRTESEQTPLQAAIHVFSLRASIFLGIMTVVIFGIGVAAGEPLIDMFITAVAVAVSAVPEGLPIAMTVILAIGVQRMARRKGVVRKLAAAEALGSADIILTDKTGTLTTARMEIGSLIPQEGVEESKLLELALTNANTVIENPQDPPSEWRIDGRLIETALVRSAALRGINVPTFQETLTITDSLPFNAVNKYSVSLSETQGARSLVYVGAPDILLRFTALDSDTSDRLLTRIDTEASEGSLVLGVATQELPANTAFSFEELTPSNLIFKGLITLHDPIRETVPEAIRMVEETGVRVILVTGDHKGTALAIATAAGMKVNPEGVLDSVELRELSDAGLIARLDTLSIVARVSPLDKMRIVQAFQSQKKVVAMTGDGVNDAPSIKQADIGIAMGSGTAVARDVADLVLLDDNFETIAAAIDEGRQIRGNLQKVLVYLLSDTADNLFLIGGALLAGLAIPLTALQILWVNFFSDSFPAVAFAFEKERDARHYHLRRTALFTPLMGFLILFVGVATSAFLFFLYWYLLQQGYPDTLVRTFIFASFASYTILSAFAFRNLTRSIFSYSFFSNKAMLAGVGLGLGMIGIALYVPLFQDLLDTVALPLPWLMGVLGVAVLNITAIEVGKWLFQTHTRMRRPA